MADFSWICKNLKGSAPSKGESSGTGSCAKGLETGPYCMADTPALAEEGKAACPGVDYLKILALHKKK